MIKQQARQLLEWTEDLGLLVIAIVALARYLILDMKAMDNWRMLAASGAALVLAITVLAIRYAHTHFPYGKDE